MLKASAQAPASAFRAQRRAAPAVHSTRERMVAAAVASLREEGFAGTSARSIARHGNFNQALIFYHFGSVLDLLVAALEIMSAERLRQYRAALDAAPDLSAALSIARREYQTDIREGHITVLAELVAGSSSLPALGAEIVRCMAPWTRFAEESIRRFLSGTSLETMIPAAEAARALVAMYVGMELLDHLDPRADTAAPLFRTAERLLQAMQPLMAPTRSRTDATSRPRRVRIEA